ncbi:hypothetical protein [Nocardiopsis synnemataformans]|uniref:hypothetical protein n=1 Tax=Nocardiopsis synnemataformans TaxID=61305 RepID=UPI003EC0B337
MVNLRRADYGPAATKAVNLVAIFYNSAVVRDPESNAVEAVYLDNRLHPEDRRAPGQSSLALVTTKDAGTRSGYNTMARFTPKQARAIREAAGSNTTPVLNKNGEQVGIAFGYQADLFFSKKEGGAIPKITTVRPSGLSVHPGRDGKTIMSRIFEKQAANKAAKQNQQARGATGQGWVQQQPETAKNEPQMG